MCPGRVGRSYSNVAPILLLKPCDKYDSISHIRGKEDRPHPSSSVKQIFHYGQPTRDCVVKLS